MSLETRSVIDALRSEMENQILSGTIPAGATLTELSVAQRFDVARPTAKAAIEQLVHSGMLSRARNKSARVARLGPADIADLYLSRGVIESAVVRVLAGHGEVPRAALEAQDRFRLAIVRGNEVGEIVAADIAFHRALAAATRSPRLRRLHEAVIVEAHLCMARVQMRHLLDPQVIADEHARVLARIEAGDAAGAAAEMDAHLARARGKLADYVDAGPAQD